MRLAALGFACAPLALLALGSLESKAYPVYPVCGYSESITCAAVGDDRMLRATLGFPRIIPISQPRGDGIVVGPESISCAAVGDDRMMRTVLGCPVY